MNQLGERDLEDFAVGQTFASGRLCIDKGQVLAFAAEFDPRPFRLDESRWPRTVRPDNELCIECEVMEVRPSKSRPEQGLMKLRTTTLNPDDEAVPVHVVNLVMLRRNEHSC